MNARSSAKGARGIDVSSAGRRRMLLAASAVPLCAIAGRAAAAPRAARIASLSWTGTDVLLSIGATPAAVADKSRFNDLSIDARQHVPASCLELGLVAQPNLEALAQSKPDLIVADYNQQRVLDELRTIAPVFYLDIYRGAGGDIYARTRRETLRLAGAIGLGDRARATVSAVEADLDACRQTVRSLSRVPPVLIAQLFTDGRHLNVYGRDTLVQDVMDRIGVRNAWRGATPIGHVTTLGIADLADLPEVQLFYLSDNLYSPIALRNLGRSALWRRLPFVRQHQFAPLTRFYAFGGLQSARRFAGELSSALVRINARYG